MEGNLSRLPLVALYVAALALAACSSGPAVSYSPIAEASAPEVIVYVISKCPHCAKARAFMDQEGITYEARDVRTNAKAKAEFQAMGGSAVPLFIIGRTQVRGLDKISVRELVAATRRREAQSH